MTYCTLQLGGIEDGYTFVAFLAEDTTVTLPLTPVGEHLYRINGVPCMVEGAAFGDVIEAEPMKEGGLRFIRVAEPGGWRTFDYILSRGKINGAWGQSLLREFEARGGHWEVLFGGCLFVCVPPSVDIDPTPWVESLYL